MEQTASFRRKRYKKRNDCVLGSRHYQLFDFGFWYELLYGVGDTLFTVGIVVGIIGLIGVGISYPLYVCITKKERERLAPEILRLTDELLK